MGFGGSCGEFAFISYIVYFINHRWSCLLFAKNYGKDTLIRVSFLYEDVIPQKHLFMGLAKYSST
ncbi:hypothetical protein AAHB65_11385 [Bacillus toyonensis]